jgi:hypothetical protein
MTIDAMNAESKEISIFPKLYLSVLDKILFFSVKIHVTTTCVEAC